MSTQSSVPDREFTLSASRSRTRTFTSRFTIAIGAPALTLAAIAAGGGFAASPTAQPAAQVRPIGQEYRSTAVPGTVQAVSAAAFAASVGARGATGATLTSASVGAAASQFTTRAILTATHRLGRNRLIAWRMMHRRFGWRPRNQFRFLNWLWNRESGWYVYAANPYSGAYGIPQAVPGSKMASAGGNWRSCARTQIRWGMRYIKGRYGTPRHAWRHEVAYGWY